MGSGSRESRPSIATAILTRGYSLNSFHDYRFVIRRNRSIIRNLVVPSSRAKIDHFIFHEGNVGLFARIAIRVASLPLNLRFVNLGEFFAEFRQERNPENVEKCPETELSLKFSVEYRAMCAFWMNGFLEYLGGYDVVFRLDEDCLLESLNYATVLQPLIEAKVDYCAGMAFGFDAPGVTRGLEGFVTKWHEEHPRTRAPKLDRNPYTNVFLLRPKALESNPEALSFLKHVRSSGCVLNNRWGDHVIWGALLSMYVDTIKSNLSADVSYFHGSHGTMVSQENNPASKPDGDGAPQQMRF